VGEVFLNTPGDASNALGNLFGRENDRFNIIRDVTKFHGPFLPLV
jgi:hypothetical protein